MTHVWEGAGLTVARLGFPRYGESVHADLASEALHGAHGDLTGSVYAMALLFALDRQGAAHDLRRLINRTDIVLLDRYVASNAAYSAARLGQDADGAVVTWVRELEFERFALPVPDIQLLLHTPVDVAAARAAGRAAADAARERDAYERDGGLQRRTATVYEQLAQRDWVSHWRIVESDEPAQLAADLVNQLSSSEGVTR